MSSLKYKNDHVNQPVKQVTLLQCDFSQYESNSGYSKSCITLSGSVLMCRYSRTDRQTLLNTMVIPSVYPTTGHDHLNKATHHELNLIILFVL